VSHRESSAHRVVGAQHLRSGDLGEVPVEALLDRGERPEVVEVIDLDVGEDRAVQRQLEVGAVALVGLDDEPLAPVHCAPVPMSVTSPPITKLGRRPASARISMSIDVVVVLPWVPATASDLACAQIDASMPARRSTGTVGAGLVELDVPLGDRRCCT
jgi:hypothetical protein